MNPQNNVVTIIRPIEHMRKLMVREGELSYSRKYSKKEAVVVCECGSSPWSPLNHHTGIPLPSTRTGLLTN